MPKIAIFKGKEQYLYYVTFDDSVKTNLENNIYTHRGCVFSMSIKIAEILARSGKTEKGTLFFFPYEKFSPYPEKTQKLYWFEKIFFQKWFSKIRIQL